MSWEIDGQTRHSCPCGQGTWVEVRESDDWGRSRSSASIECPVCQRTHRMKEVHGDRKGMPTVSYRVVSIEESKT